MLGDAKAETVFNIQVAGGQAVITTNCHFLSTVSSGSPHTPKSKKGSKKIKKPKSMSLPSLCVVNCGLTLNITLPMYSGNATPDSPQRTQLKAKLCDVQAGTLTLQRLDDARKYVAISKGDSAPSEFKQFLHVPDVELNYHSKRHGESDADKDRSYFQLDIDKVMSSLSHTHLSKLLFLTGTWTAMECYPSSADMECPAHPGTKLGHLHMSMFNSSMSYSGTDYYSLTSAVLGELSLSIVKDSSAKKLGCLLPVLYGPISTHNWNNIDFYKQSSSIPPSAPSERLVELFIARPYQHMKGLLLDFNFA